MKFQFTDEDSPRPNLLLSVMKAFVEFECTLIKENQMEDGDITKKCGVHKSRKAALSDEQIIQLKKQVILGHNTSELTKEI